MNTLQTGQFYGVTNETTTHGGLTLTDTEYTHEHVDWHYHQNAYFTFILDGRVIEANKKVWARRLSIRTRPRRRSFVSCGIDFVDGGEFVVPQGLCDSSLA